MSTLARQENLKALLNRANMLTIHERRRLEDLWFGQGEIPEAPTPTKWTISAFQSLIQILVISTFFAASWYPKLLPICNILSALLWIIMIITPVVMVFVLGLTVTKRKEGLQGLKSLLIPANIKLLRKTPRWERIYGFSLNILLVVSIASAGFIVTAVYIGFASLATIIFLLANKDNIHKAVADFSRFPSRPSEGLFIDV